MGDAARRAEAQLRGAELEEHVGAGLGRWRLRQRPSEPGDGRGGGAAGERVARHPAQERDPTGVAGRLGLDELGGDPFLRRAACLEDPGATGVGVGELAWTDVHAHGLAHDRVGELEAVRGPEDVEGDQPIRGAGRVLLGELGHRRRLGEAGAVAEHRHRSHQGARGRRSCRQAEQDRLGHLRRSDPPHAQGLVGAGRQPPLGGLTQ